jgi:putative oxidoreductase
MNKILNHAIWNTHALLFARVLMGALFVMSGIQKFQGIDGTAGYIASAGLPASLALAWLVAVLELVFGAMLILGIYFKESALALAAYVFILSFPFHGPNMWADAPMQQTMFLKNMAIVAGLLFMAAHGAGNTWKLKKGS